MSLIKEFQNIIAFYKKNNGDSAVLTAEQVNLFIRNIELLDCGYSSDYIKGFMMGYFLCRRGDMLREKQK